MGEVRGGEVEAVEEQVNFVLCLEARLGSPFHSGSSVLKPDADRMVRKVDCRRNISTVLCGRVSVRSKHRLQHLELLVSQLESLLPLPPFGLSRPTARSRGFV